MAPPLVSVVLPAYNEEIYLGQALDSLLRQTFTDFEVLIVDDNSTDRTADIIRAYAATDARLRPLTNELDKGIVGALNTGLKHATGKYIARADADDINRPQRLELEVHFLDQHPEIGIVGGGFATFTDEHAHRMDMFHPTDSLEIAWQFLTDSRFAHPTVMFRREVYEYIGGYPSLVPEDYAYFCQVLTTFRGANLPVILIDYRERASGLSISKAEESARSVDATSRQVFRAYGGSDAHYDAFKRFQNQGTVYLRELLAPIVLNHRILRQIRVQYGMSALESQVMRLHLRLWWRYCAIVFTRIASKFTPTR